MTWKLTATANHAAIHAALARAEDEAAWDAELPISGVEIDEAGDVWALECWMEKRPTPAQQDALAALFDGEAPAITAEQLPETDWLTQSQQGTPPIRAGRFHVHTPDYPPLAEPGVVDFCIPAAQAFGTGQHATTAGCLEMLETMRRQGLAPRNVADIGTGTGLLAFAARALWPHALYTSSDIDPLCVEAVVGNCERNAIPCDSVRGAVLPVLADGMAADALQLRAPYDLLIANILAGPLIDMAPDFADAVAPRGSVLLAGLLQTQEAAVRRAFRLAGFRLHRRLGKDNWSILWLRKRFAG